MRAEQAIEEQPSVGLSFTRRLSEPEHNPLKKTCSSELIPQSIVTELGRDSAKRPNVPHALRTRKPPKKTSAAAKKTCIIV